MSDQTFCAVHPADAPSSLRALLCGATVRGRVLGVFAHAVYVGVGGAPNPLTLGGFAPGPVVAVVTRDGIRQPNALVLRAASTDGLFRGLASGTPAAVGAGGVLLGDARRQMDIRAARWTDRRPLIGAVRLPALRRSTETLAELRLADRDDDVLTARVERLAAAMRRRDLAVAARSARALVGLGRGLTPSGDDILAGLLSGMHAFTRGTPSPTADALLDAIWSAIAPDLRDRTTTLSAALLGHAAVGEMATPAADLAVAMVTGGDLTSARERLLAVGHSSGRDLARGLELAGATVTHLFRTSALAITQPAGARS